MDVTSGSPFWALANGLMQAFPQLAQDRSCDVAVIGGGITGAIIANELVEHDHDVVVVEQRDLAQGSTAASTALLQYEIDTHMTDLARAVGERDAALAYVACAAAIPQLAALAAEVRDVGFANRDSLYYASKWRHVAAMKDELAMRTRHGLPVTWLASGEVRERFGFDAPGALLSRLGAVVDPYRFAHRLFARLSRRGAGIFDRTRVASTTPTSRGVTLVTDRGVTLRAKHVVVATGYESQRWIDQRVARNHSSYACISDPLTPAVLGELATTLLWESARPYLYLRTTPDYRLLVGGEDDLIDIPAKRDARVSKRASTLAARVNELFPHLAMRPVYAWAGTFAETEDGLPFFGAHEQHGPRVHFAMAFGGNGITYSAIGAKLVRAAIERHPHELAKLFSFRRLGA